MDKSRKEIMMDPKILNQAKWITLTKLMLINGIFIFWCFLFSPLPLVRGGGKFDWFKYDNFDIVDKQITSVNGKNCHSKSPEQLMLRSDTVAQLPVYNQLLSRVWYRNRTTLIHLHNMALNRAFFYR